jgi:hypothetical protein
VTGAVSHFKARRAVNNYRNEPMGRFPTHQTTEEAVLRRLEADPDGKVTAALNRLSKVPAHLVIFHLMAAVDLPRYADQVIEQHHSKATIHADRAAEIRRLMAVCQGKAPLEYIQMARCWTEFHTDQARRWSEIPSSIKRTRETKNGSAPVLMAVRHFRERLRDMVGMQSPSQEAIRLLIEVAMDQPVHASMVKNALKVGKQSTPPGKRA